MIRTHMPFYLYADCVVEYDGRAKSVLNRGNYVILHKSDGTLIIHGNSLVTPLNYQSSKAVMRQEGNKLISDRKDERIIIELYNIYDYHEFTNWSNNKIDIKNTESDLRDKLVDNINNYFNNIVEVIKEHGTPYGPVDILVINDVNNIIEVKRKKITLNNCMQLEKYMKYFNDINERCSGYLAGPDISSNAIEYINNNCLNYINIDFN